MHWGQRGRQSTLWPGDNAVLAAALELATCGMLALCKFGKVCCRHRRGIVY